MAPRPTIIAQEMAPPPHSTPSNSSSQRLSQEARQHLHPPRLSAPLCYLLVRYGLPVSESETQPAVLSSHSGEPISESTTKPTSLSSLPTDNDPSAKPTSSSDDNDGGSSSRSNICHSVQISIEIRLPVAALTVAILACWFPCSCKKAKRSSERHSSNMITKALWVSRIGSGFLWRIASWQGSAIFITATATATRGITDMRVSLHRKLTAPIPHISPATKFS